MERETRRKRRCEMNKSGISNYLYIIAGILFLACAILGGSAAFYALGLFFIILGVTEVKKDKDN